MSARIRASMRSRPARWRAEERSEAVAENGDSAFVGSELRPLRGLSGVSGWLFAVADGLGGEGHDDVASQTAVDTLAGIFSGDLPVENLDFDTPDGWLRSVVDQVNRTLCRVRRERALEGAYTTLAIALLVPRPDEGLECYLANVGDSRLYLLRGDKLLCLTRDDGEGGMVTRVVGDPNLFAAPYLRHATTVARTRSLTQKMVTAIETVLTKRRIVDDDTQASLVAPLLLAVLEGAFPIELAATFSPALHRIALQAGPEGFERLMRDVSRVYMRAAERLAPVALKPNDRLLLCTDGISNAFAETFIRDALISGSAADPGEDELDDILTLLTESEGWVDDDRTAVLVHVVEVA